MELELLFGWSSFCGVGFVGVSCVLLDVVCSQSRLCIAAFLGLFTIIMSCAVVEAL